MARTAEHNHLVEPFRLNLTVFIINCHDISKFIWSFIAILPISKYANLGLVITPLLQYVIVSEF